MSNVMTLIMLAGFGGTVYGAVRWVRAAKKHQPLQNFRLITLIAAVVMVLGGALIDEMPDAIAHAETIASHAKTKYEKATARRQKLTAEAKSLSADSDALADEVAALSTKVDKAQDIKDKREAAIAAAKEKAEKAAAAKKQAAAAQASKQRAAQAAASSAAQKQAAAQSRAAASQRAAATQSSGQTAQGDLTTGQQGKIIGNVNSKIYHVPGQAGYHMNSANAVYFNSEAEAQAAGYRKSKR